MNGKVNKEAVQRVITLLTKYCPMFTPADPLFDGQGYSLASYIKLIKNIFTP